jgi:hypothetical protein
MEESDTYQAIIEKGVAQGVPQGVAQGIEQGRVALRKALINLGTKRLGTPPLKVRKILERINDIDRLEKLTERVVDVANWKELLESP